MAATDARPVPRKNLAWRMYFALRKNDGTLLTSWTGQDSEVSLDGATFADCTNEATEIGSSGCGYLDLTAAEMNADGIVIKITTTNSGSLPLVVTVFPEESGDYRGQVTGMAANTLTASALASDAVTEIAGAVSGGSAISVVLPAYGTIQDRVEGTKIKVFYNEETSVAIAVADANGNAVALSGKTLAVAIENRQGVDVLSISNGDIAKSGSTATFTVTDAVTQYVDSFKWSLRDLTGGSNVVLAHGVLEVAYAAEVDA